MVAVLVTGSLMDFGGLSLVPNQVQLVFRPSREGISGSSLLDSRDVLATMTSTYAWSVMLEPTDALPDDTWYTILAQSLSGTNPPTELTLWQKFRVPIGGGDIGTFPGVPLRADTAWVGLESNPPPDGFKGWWLVSGPGDPSVSGSGDLRMVN